MGDTLNVTMSRKHFQALHSAARSVLRYSISTYDHTPEAASFLILLDEAINAGHEVLGTDRPSADRYIDLMIGVTELQRKQAAELLSKADLQKTT